MGFFKKLKDKIFNKSTEENKDDFLPKKNSEQKVFLKEAKIEKKEEKKRNRQIAKEKKIDKYVAGLSKSGINLTNKIKELQNKHNKIDELFFDDLEEILIMSDISINLVYLILDEIKKEIKKENVSDKNLINEIIIDKMFAIYANQSVIDTSLNINNAGLNIIMIVGVNGSGKTTTIAKLMNKYKNEGKKILVAAADTFRAGAVDQLQIWANRVGCDIVVPEKENADPSSVIYQAIEKTKNFEYDLLIIDTAGRLQNKVNLMNELSKMKKIIERSHPQAPHEILLVLDATTGQNGINQAKVFKEVTNISGIILTKMDGTSNGGIILAIKDILDINVKLIGLGEKIDDLQEFDLDSYIYGLVKDLISE
ncbi:MAG: signal recognition particle-docking protein FtsY [Metamycoplasmataceae bacterium]